MKIIGGRGGVGAEDAAPGILSSSTSLVERSIFSVFFSGLMAMEMCAKDLFELSIRFFKENDVRIERIVFNSINALGGAATNE
jgi:hypothetical protein